MSIDYRELRDIQSFGVCREDKDGAYLHTYVAAIAEGAQIGTLACAERMAEIASARNPAVRLEKHCVFRLLEYALMHSLGIDASDVKFRKSERGGWECDACKFSLSHSAGAVAVAISDKEVGVDIEPLKPTGAQRYARRILTPREYAEYVCRAEAERCELFLCAWCKKESIFKCGIAPDITAASIEVGSYPALAARVQIADKDYILAVCSHNMDNKNPLKPCEFDSLKAKLT